ncbi:MAG TPA: gamma-glutamyl-gamma-aminobutyrate hydrolase family protein [Abditibacterium sp.]|jgi:putative glutamine amidotransferase
MPKPLILLSAGRTMIASRSDDAQAVKMGCDADYINAIVRAGGAPLLLPPHGDKEATRAAVSVADALLLSGGGDIHSLCYGHEPHPKSYDQDPARDATEFLALEFALKRGLPVLGICRGIELINVAMGGTLIQHISSGENAVKHDSKGFAGLLLHTISIETDSLLFQILGANEIAVNSFHHQATGEVGAGLRVTARAKDGIIEALESSDGRPILGVQFHPEECAPFHPNFDKLFKWLVKKSRER